MDDIERGQGGNSMIDMQERYFPSAPPPPVDVNLADETASNASYRGSSISNCFQKYP